MRLANPDDTASVSDQIETPSSPVWRADIFNGYAHATARENQLLAIDWGAMSRIDVRAIWNVAAKWLKAPTDLADGEALLALLGTLTTGRAFDEWLGYTLRGLPSVLRGVSVPKEQEIAPF